MNLTLGSVCSMIPVPTSPRITLTVLDDSGLSFGVLGFAVVVTDLSLVDPDAPDAPIEATTALEPVICHLGRFAPASAILVDEQGQPLPYQVALR